MPPLDPPGSSHAARPHPADVLVGSPEGAPAPALADRYRVERELGRGGMATVWLAEDLRHGRRVAIKVLHPELSAVLGPERFLAEIKTTANLQHPHVLPLFDSGSAEGQLYYVMPYVAGETLRDRLTRETQLPVADALRIAREVAGALQYAHARGIIHRDVKPENVLLQDGHALVADFGIALAVAQAGGQRMTQTGLSLGTPQYMAPEQAMGERTVDARADVYALGAVLYEMLAGEPPFTGPTAQAIVARVITEPAPSVRAKRPTVPPPVDAAVATALQKLPADRFASAADFAAALERPDTAGIATAPGAAAGAPRADRRWRLAALASGAVALASLAAVAALVRTRRGEPAPPLRARFTLEMPDSARMIRSPNGQFAALAPDGTALAFLSRSPEQGVFVRQFDDLLPHALPGTASAEAVAFSPDGRWVAFQRGTTLFKVPLAGGGPQLVADSVTAGGFAWLDGGTIVFTRADATGRAALWRVSDAGGRAEPLTRVDVPREQRHRMPAALPGGRAALFAVQVGAGESAPYELAAVRLADGGVVRLGIQGMAPAYADGFLVYRAPGYTVAAVPFDPERLQTTGDPVPSLLPSNVLWTVAPNGTLVEYRNADVSELISVDRRGVVRALGAPRRLYYHPRLSPDGRRVAVSIGRPPLGAEVWVLDLASGTLTQLTPERGNLFPEWMPDGRRVAWTHGGDAPAIWWQPWDASAPAERLLAGGQGTWPLGDGSAMLTIVLRPGGTRELRVVPLPIDTTRWSPPIATRRMPGFPMARPSPDGRWIAYVDEQSGVNDVFVRARAGGGRHQVSVGGGTEPSWSRDGTELFYRTAGAMMAARLDLGAEARVVRRDTLFAMRFPPGDAAANYTVTPDGSHFILPRPVTVAEQPTVVLGWTAELRDRLRGSRASRGRAPGSGP